MRRDSGCGVVDASGVCSLPVEAESGMNVCSAHLAAAYDWVSRDVGVTDVLPSACLACGSRLGVRYPSGWLCAVCEWRVGEVAADDLAAVRVDVVYYLRFGDRIKIGTSGNPRSRLAQLRYDELLAFERGGRTTEQRRHAQFAESRFPGSEWFRSTDALKRHIASVGAGTEDPWRSYALWRSQAIALL